MTKLSTLGPALAFGLAAALTPVAAQQNASDRFFRPGDAQPATAVPAHPTPPRVDGRLDDPAWRTAPAFGEFRQRDPHEGEPGTEVTEFRVVYTPTALFVAVRAYDSQPGTITAILGRRDGRTPADEIEIMIDSYRDRRTGYLFAVNAAGVKRDAFLYNDTRRDDRWDAVWEGAATVDSLGWVAEFRIPLSQLRFAAAEVEAVGFNVSRRLARLNEEQYWRLAPKTTSGVVSQFGDLTGMALEPPRRLEIQPYVMASVERNPVVAGNPFRTGGTETATVGGDIRYGVTSSLNLTATLNPDFGQVEGDPAEVNLTAFETFQSERRPFFTEGLDLFRFPVSDQGWRGGREGLFYSRRIGRSPQGRADLRGGFAESGGQTTILGAGKLTGKTPGGWTVGLMAALTNRETAAVIDSVGAPHLDMIEPRTGYMVARVARDLNRGGTVLGAFGTTVQRDLGPGLSFLHSAAYTGGVDLSHRFRRNTYRVEARVLGSYVRGSETAIARTQTTSARYFQRPDRDDVTFDPTRTSLAGYAYSFNLEKEAGGNWRWNAGLERRSPGLELNDVGFLQRADRTHQWASVSRNWFQPGRVFRSFRLELSQQSYWTSAWERRNLGVDLSARFTFRNYWSGWINVGHDRGGIAPEALRGGPAIDRPGETSARFNLRSDNRRAVRVGASTSFSVEHESPSWQARFGTDFSWRPAANVDLSLDPGLTLNRSAWQYLRRVSVSGADEYVFGDLHQRTVSMEMRGSVTLSPTLSLQLYAQPFVSTGRYDGYLRVRAPRATRFLDQFEAFEASQVTESASTVSLDSDRDGTADISFGRPDFTYLSLVSNVVLRWEYVLGSTLFVVWQHGRSDRLTDGRFDLDGSVDRLFSAPSENVLLVKFNYWLNP